jgi:hypothetical protein
MADLISTQECRATSHTHTRHPETSPPSLSHTHTNVTPKPLLLHSLSHTQTSPRNLSSLTHSYTHTHTQGVPEHETLTAARISPDGPSDRSPEASPVRPVATLALREERRAEETARSLHVDTTHSQHNHTQPQPQHTHTHTHRRVLPLTLPLTHTATFTTGCKSSTR